MLLEELESIKSKSDISKKKFEDSLHASRKKLEQELELIEKKRKAQEDVRWSRPMSGFSSTLSPSKHDGFSVSPSSSPTPTRRDYSASSPSPSKYDDSPSSPQLSHKTERLTSTPPPDFSSTSSSTHGGRFSPLPDRYSSSPKVSHSLFK